MTRSHENELSAKLAAHVRSADAVPEDAIDSAQQALLLRLQSKRRPARTHARGWWAVAATAVIAAAMMIAGPMLSGGGDAFAAVQARFRHFDTLSMTITQRFGDRATQTAHTIVDARGVVRTDVGEQLSVIVDAPRGRVLTLLHEPRQAMVATIPKNRPATDDALSWLDDLRNFKGHATPLPETRIIDGRTARGWTLQAGGTTMELWADADDLPLAMRQSGGGGLEIDYRFEFDQPIPPGLLSSDPPAGYAPVAPDED
jgi:hypothetical protein